MASVAMFRSLGLDELISARPAAGHSFRNPVERCHYRKSWFAGYRYDVTKDGCRRGTNSKKFEFNGRN